MNKKENKDFYLTKDLEESIEGLPNLENSSNRIAKKFSKNKTNKKKILTKKNVSLIVILISILTVILVSFFMKRKKVNNLVAVSSENLRAMTYGEFSDDDSKTNSDYVRFGAFFLRDIDNDGVADKIKGTCREIGKEDILYMELNILTNGSFEDGKITINADNFYLQTAIPKDTEIKENAVGNNTKEIKLNTIGSGTQKLITGIVRAGDYSSNSNYYAAIGNDTTKFSKINSITLTGTHVTFDGKRTEINKTVEFNVDWYSSTQSEIPTYIAGNERNLNQIKDIKQAIDEENDRINLEFNLGIQEKNNKTILKSANITATVPQINGYSPIDVLVLNSNTEYK